MGAYAPTVGDRVTHAYTAGWKGTVRKAYVTRAGRKRAQVHWDSHRVTFHRNHDADLLRKVVD